MQGAVRFQDHGQARHAFLADNGDFDAVIAACADHHRSDAMLEEIDMLDAAVAHFQLAAHRQIDRRQMRRQQREIACTECGQHLVRCGFASDRQNAHSSKGKRACRVGHYSVSLEAMGT